MGRGDQVVCADNLHLGHTGGDRGWPGDVPKFRYDIARLQARHSVKSILENGF